MKKRQFLSSNQVCKKCKHNIRNGVEILNSPKNNSLQLELPNLKKIKTIQSKNSVFNESFKCDKVLYDSDHMSNLSLIKVISSLSVEIIDNQIKNLLPLNKSIILLFLKGKLSKLNFKSLNQIQQNLIFKLISNKNERNIIDKENESFLNFIPSKRRTEENIKFIFNRAIRSMVYKFKNKIFPLVQKYLKPRYLKMTEKEQIDFAFFGFYFGEESVRLDIPIDEFLLPKKKINRKNKNKLKFNSISKQYLQLLTINPRFLKDIRFYLVNFFMLEMLQDTIKKVQIIINKTKKVDLNGKTKNGENINIKNIMKTTHMPWNVYELENGLKDLIKYLRL